MLRLLAKAGKENQISNRAQQKRVSRITKRGNLFPAPLRLDGIPDQGRDVRPAEPRNGANTRRRRHIDLGEVAVDHDDDKQQPTLAGLMPITTRCYVPDLPLAWRPKFFQLVRDYVYNATGHFTKGDIMGFSFKVVSIAALLLNLGLTGFASAEDTTADINLYARSARYAWMLPKTLVSVSVTYSLTACSDATGVEVLPTVTLSNASEADTNLGPQYPDGVISILPEDMISFWQDKNITVKTNTSTRTLSYLGSVSTNQASSIIGTAITSVAKLTAAAFGTPAVGAAVPEAIKQCGKAAETLAKIKAYKDKLVDPSLTAAELKDIPGLIQSLQTELTITVEKKFDPGLKPTRINKRTGEAFIGVLAPSASQLISAHWFATDALAKEAARSEKLYTAVYLNLNDAYPAEAIREAVTCIPDGQCALTKVAAPKGTLFREVAYIPVVVRHGHQGKLVQKKTFPFGQFGIPRALPLSANLFEQITWSVTFADTGEMTDSQFTSKATGLALVSLFANAASTANAVATESRNAASALDGATVRMQNENTALKAQVDNITLSQQLNTLLSTKH
jgi:hypothetical protein